MFVPLTAGAQTSREQWLALRHVKVDEQAQAASSNAGASRNGAVNVIALHFFTDGSGNLVAVGEARNDSGADLSFARLEFVFFDSSGSYLGSEQSYVHGGRNKRVIANGLYTNVLGPGETGFFKLWTTIPAASVASHRVGSAAEEYATELPASPVNFSLRDSPNLVGQRYSGSLWQTPAGQARFLRVPSVAYFAHVAVATYQDGVITDVQVSAVHGPSFVTGCGETTTQTVFPFSDSTFTFDFARPVNTVRSAFEFEENGIPLPASGYTLDWAGGVRSFAVARRCGWTAVPDVPWIHVVENASSAGPAGIIAFTVDPSPELEDRQGTINVSGMEVRVTQSPRCPITLPFFLAPRRHAVLGASGHFRPGTVFTPNCPVALFTNEPWLRVNGASSIVLGAGTPQLTISAAPNTTGASRRGTVYIGHIAVSVEQTPASREVDFDRNGSLDLIWQNQTDGAISAWLMNGMTLIDGTFFFGEPSPYFQRNEPGLALSAAGDLNRDGSVDIIWQNSSTGLLDYSALQNITREREHLLSPHVVADTAWKIKSVGDFNQDGDADLVWQHENDGRIAIWFMNGPVQISGEPLGPGQVPDLQWKIVGSGDFDADGWRDLVWQHQGDGRIAVWKMRGATMLAGDLIVPGQVADLHWKIRAIGDINGDDKTDLIWHHRLTGHVSAWLMSGTTMMSGIVIRRVPDTSWQIVGPR